VLDIGASMAHVDGIALPSAQVTVTPGAVSAYLGNVTDTAFEDRGTAIDAGAEVTPAVLASLSLAPAIGLPISVNVGGEATASVASPAPSVISVSGPYPAPVSVGTSVSDALLGDLLADLDVSIGATGLTLGGGGDSLLDANVTSALTSALG